MVYPLIPSGNPLQPIPPLLSKPSLNPRLLHLRPIRCSQLQNPNTIDKPRKPITRLRSSTIITLDQVQDDPIKNNKGSKPCVDKNSSFQVGRQQMLALCGFGYWVQGFRCFPWLALNFHLAHNLSLRPSTLQLVQHSANLPMAVKPLYGILSDALYIGGARRIPYISIGVLLQVLSWGSLACFPVAREALSVLMIFVLLSNLGASITEVAKDALVAEYGQKNKMTGLQSYAFMALAAGGVLGNLLGGFFLLKSQPKTMFLLFAGLLSLQLAISLKTREHSLGFPRPSDHNNVRKSVTESIRKPFSDLVVAISDVNISRPLIWIVASIAMVPILSGSVFCYQTQCLNLNPSIIGMSRVIGQLMLLSTTFLYDRFRKRIPMRKLVGMVQILYAASFLGDLLLVKQINLKLGIPNEVFALCFSGLTETVAQFKLLPFSVLLASLAPPGCEGSLISFFASALCLASIVSGFLGVGLASLIGVTTDDYSSLPLGILIQFLASLVPLKWIYHVPTSLHSTEKERKKGRSKRTRRNRRVGRVVVGSLYAFRQERESEAPM